MTFRQDKAAARLDLHATMAEPVLYFAKRAAPRVVHTARLHLNFGALGDLRNGGFADWQEMTPKAIFTADVYPLRDSYIVTETLGVFRIADVEPRDDVTRKASIIELPTAEAKRLGWNTDLPWCGEPAPEIV